MIVVELMDEFTEWLMRRGYADKTEALKLWEAFWKRLGPYLWARWTATSSQAASIFSRDCLRGLCPVSTHSFATRVSYAFKSFRLWPFIALG